MLWIFYMFNAVYIDITTLYYSVFINHYAEVHYTQAFLTRSRRPHRDFDLDGRPVSCIAVPGKSPGQHRSRRVLGRGSDRDAIRRNADFGLSVLRSPHRRLPSGTHGSGLTPRPGLRYRATAPLMIAEPKRRVQDQPNGAFGPVRA